MNDINSAKLRASFKTYIVEFLNYIDLGLGRKSVTVNEMSSLINKDSFTKDIVKEKTGKGHYLYSLERR